MFGSIPRNASVDGLPVRLLDHQIPGSSYMIPITLGTASVSTTFRPHGLFRTLCLSRQTLNVSTPVALKGPLVLYSG